MNIGSVRKNNTGIFVGKVQTHAIDMTVALRETVRANPAQPAFDIFARNVAGNYIAIGALWEKAVKDTGELYYTGRIDDPSMATPLQIAAFLQTDGSINVVWTRPSKAAAITTRTAADATPDDLAGAPGFASTEQGDGLGESTAPASRSRARKGVEA